MHSSSRGRATVGGLAEYSPTTAQLRRLAFPAAIDRSRKIAIAARLPAKNGPAPNAETPIPPVVSPVDGIPGRKGKQNPPQNSAKK